jgi:hypothetical protein
MMEVEEAQEAALIGSYQQTGILNSRPSKKFAFGERRAAFRCKTFGAGQAKVRQAGWNGYHLLQRSVAEKHIW